MHSITLDPLGVTVRLSRLQLATRTRLEAHPHRRRRGRLLAPSSPSALSTLLAAILLLAAVLLLPLPLLRVLALLLISVCAVLSVVLLVPRILLVCLSSGRAGRRWGSTSRSTDHVRLRETCRQGGGCRCRRGGRRRRRRDVRWRRCCVSAVCKRMKSCSHPVSSDSLLPSAGRLLAPTYIQRIRPTSSSPAQRADAPPSYRGARPCRPS